MVRYLLRNDQFNEYSLIRFVNYIPGIKGMSQAVSTIAMAIKIVILILIVKFLLLEAWIKGCSTQSLI